MYMNAYYCILYEYLCPSCPVLRATTLWNLASIFAAALPCILRALSTISKNTRKMALIMYVSEHRTGPSGYPAVQLCLTCDQIHT